MSASVERLAGARRRTQQLAAPARPSRQWRRPRRRRVSWPARIARLVGVVLDHQHAQAAESTPARARHRLRPRLPRTAASNQKRRAAGRRRSRPDRGRPSARPAAGRSPGPGRCRRSCASSTASACVNAWNRRGSASGGMPMPVSLHREVQTQRRRCVRRRSSATSTTTSPRSVNLTALASRLASTWRSRSGSPTQQRRHAARRCRTAARAPSRRPCGASSSSTSSTSVAQVELDASRARACRPRSSRSRGCR